MSTSTSPITVVKRGIGPALEATTYTDVTVNNQADSEDSVEEGVVSAASNERCGGHRDKSGRQEALKCPVVRAVDARGWWERRRVVHSALVDGYTYNIQNSYCISL